MKAEDRYDSLIQWNWFLGEKRYGVDPDADWRLVKCQIRVESSFNPKARNPRSGALGLLQLIAVTDLETDGVRDADNPEEAIREGVAYLWKEWAVFRAEKGLERWKFALGSYNAGAGNIINAQALAQSRGFDPSRWVSIVQTLHDVTGYKNSAETTAYVATIIGEYEALRKI